jgi:hypothetical protein
MSKSYTLQARARHNRIPGYSTKWHGVATVSKEHTAQRLKAMYEKDPDIEIRIVTITEGPDSSNEF